MNKLNTSACKIVVVAFLFFNILKVNAQSVMLQAWWWEYPKTAQGKSFVDTLINKSKYLADRGFKYLWLPPLSLSQGGGSSNGYDIYDYYSLGTSNRKTGFGTGTKVNQLMDSIQNHGMYAIADVVYNHRSGGSAEANPAVKGWIENYTYQKHVNGDNCYPSDRFRNIIPIGEGTGLGAGTYYFKIKSASGHPDYYNKGYQFAIWTKRKILTSTVINESEPNGGGDCGQGNNIVLLGTRMNASIDAGGCAVDEFQVTLNASDLFNTDTIFITLMNTGGFADQYIYGIWYSATNSDIHSQMIYQTYTSFQNVPSGRGQFNYLNFKPNGSPTCLCGDTDWMWFFYDVDQTYIPSRDTLRTWTKWLCDSIRMSGLRIDAVKHMPSSFLGDMFNYLHNLGINPKMIVGEAYDYDAAILKNRVDEVYSYMNNSTKDSIVYRLFDFNLQAALRDACDAFGYDARNVFISGMVDNQNMNRLNAVTFVNNHDFRDEYNHVDNDPILAYAYLLTNPTVGTPCVYYEDYLTNKYSGYTLKINKLISAYNRYLKNAAYREYLNRFNTPYSANFVSGASSNALIYQLGGTADAPCSNNDGAVVAINFSGQPMKVYQKLNMWQGYQFNVGDTLFDLTGNVVLGYSVITNNQELYINIPARSYAVFVKGSTPIGTTISAEGVTHFCLGEKVRLSADTINPCYYYQWQCNGLDLPDGDQPYYEVTQSGTYRIVVSLGGNLKKYSQGITITVSPELPVITYSNGELNATTNDSLHWYYGIFTTDMQPIDDATHLNYIPTSNGNYSVVVTDSDGCTAMSNIIHITNVGIRPTEKDNVLVYPVPAQDNFIIKGVENMFLSVTDVRGRVVLQKYINETVSKTDCSSLDSGMYFLLFRDKYGITFTEKLIILKD